MSEILGICDPVAALRVDLAAMMEWRGNEARRERERREWRARELEAQALLILAAQNGGQLPDVRELLGLSEPEPEPWSEEWMRRQIVSGGPAGGGVDFRDYPDAGAAFELRKRESQAGGVEIIAAG